MKIRNGTMMKGSLPALAAAFMCTNGAQAQVHDGISFIGAGYTSTGSVMITNNDDSRVVQGHGTCLIAFYWGHWFDMSTASLNAHGLDGWYSTLKAVDFSVHSSNNPAAQTINVRVYQELTPLTSDDTCHASTVPGPDDDSLLLIWEEETILPPSANSICGFGDCTPRTDGDRSIDFQGPTGGGLLLAPDIVVFISAGHEGEAVTRMGTNSLGEIGDGVGGIDGAVEQSWVHHTNCSAGGCGSFDWVTDLEFDDDPRDFVMQAWFEPGDDTLPPPLPFCPADFTDATLLDSPDGTVDVNELIVLLANWGALAPPRPLGDLAPLFNGDNVVDVLDLIDLLAAWGDCPIPYATCAEIIVFPEGAPNPAIVTGDGSLDFHLDGSFQDGDQRGPTNGLSEVLGGNSTDFWLNYAINGWPILGPWNADPGPFTYGEYFAVDMGLFGAGYAPPYFQGGDAWILYTASCNGRAVFTVSSGCGGGELQDSQMEIFPFTGSCPTWEESIAWGEDEAGGCSGFHATAGVNVLEDEQYLVRVGGWAGESGTATLTYTCQDNSFCASAIDLDGLGGSTTGSTAEAGIENPIACDGLSQSYGGRWYSVVGDGNTMTASTCATEAFEDTNPESAALFDSMINVYCATLETNCEDLTCVVSQQGDTSCNLHETVSWCARDGQIYYILVHGNPGVPDPINGPFFAEGFFVLDVTSDESSCTTAVACGVARPSNDNCEDSAPIVPDIDGGPGDVSDVANGGINEPDGLIWTEADCENTNATQDGHDSGDCGNTGDDLWYTYTANVFLSSVVFSTCNDAFYDTKIEIHDPALADCPTTSDDSLITCSNDDTGCGGFTTATDAIIMFEFDEVLIRVGSPDFGTQEGTGTLTVQQEEIFTLCPDPCPVGAYVEAEALLDDGDEDTTNGGCNMCTPLYEPVIDPDDLVTLGQACGQISTYNTEPDIDPCDAVTEAATDFSDTDWYEITVPDLPGVNSTSRGARTTITLASEFPGVFGIVGACDIGAPATATPFLASTVTPGICFPIDLTVDLETGTYYVVVMHDGATGLEVGGDGITHDGHDYVLSVGAYEESHLPPLNDECVDAFVVAANSSTLVDNRYATNDGVDDAPLACWYTTVGQFGSVWYKFEATHTTATIETCTQISGGDTSMGLFSGTCGSLVEISCGEDDCAPFLSQMGGAGLTVTTEYYILLTGWSSGDRDFYQLDITSP